METASPKRGFLESEHGVTLSGSTVPTSHVRAGQSGGSYNSHAQTLPRDEDSGTDGFAAKDGSLAIGDEIGVIHQHVQQDVFPRYEVGDFVTRSLSGEAVLRGAGQEHMSATAELSRIHEPPARDGGGEAVLLCGFDPELDGVLGVADGVLTGGAVGHAAGKLGNVHHIGCVFLAPPKDHLVAVGFHISL